MADLEIPSPADDLFLARGDEVNAHRPLLTGDVVADVPVPVLGADNRTVVIIAHPCAMRTNGVDLAELILVAPVVEHHDAGDHVWEKHFKVSPLDGLAGFTHAVARLDRRRSSGRATSASTSAWAAPAGSASTSSASAWSTS